MNNVTLESFSRTLDSIRSYQAICGEKWIEEEGDVRTWLVPDARTRVLLDFTIK